jgi:hypothetical protein
MRVVEFLLVRGGQWRGMHRLAQPALNISDPSDLYENIDVRQGIGTAMRSDREGELSLHKSQREVS